MIPFREMLIQVVTGTTSATPGTRTNHAHSLQRTPTLARVWVQSQAAANDTADAAAVAVVATDGTNITVKSNRDSVAFTAFIFMDIDDGFRNTA